MPNTSEVRAILEVVKGVGELFTRRAAATSAKAGAQAGFVGLMLPEIDEEEAEASELEIWADDSIEACLAWDQANPETEE